MSKQTDKSLFILPSMPRLYQHLLSGVVSFEALGGHIVKQIKIAHAFRQLESVKELARILINIPIREYQLIAQYYLAMCKCQESEYHSDVLERVIEQTYTYKTKALASRAAFEIYRGNTEQAFYFYNEAMKASSTISDYIKASTGLATLKSIEGFNKSALLDLEKLIPLLRHADPFTYFEVVNSYAVELIENNKVSEAYNASLIAVSSPFGPFYPEWQETLSDARAKRKHRSTVSISIPQHAEPAKNVLPFPAQQKAQEVETIMRLRETGIDLTPLQLLGLILKLVLKSRITDDEVDKICTAYYDAINEIWA